MENRLDFFHVVTGKKINLGQKITFKNGRKNNLYKFFFEKEPVSLHGENFSTILINNFSTSGIHLDLEQSEIILEYTDITARAIRETIVEMVRIKKYNDLPSRLSCLYATETYDDAIKWKQLFESYNRQVLQIVKVTIDGNYFKGNSDLLPLCDSTSFDKKILQAEKYWANKEKGNLPEILIDGEIEVIEIIHDFTS